MVFRKSILIIFLSLYILPLKLCAQSSSSFRPAIDSLSKLLQVSISDSQKVRVYNELCWEYGDLNFDSAFFYGNKAVELASQTEDQKDLATSYSFLGIAYWYKSEHANAIEYQLRSLKLREKIDDQKGIAVCLNNIGLIYHDQGKYEKALEHYLQYLGKSKEFNNKRGIALSCNNIGSILKLQKKYKEAVDYYLKANSTFSNINDRLGVAQSANNLGSLYDIIKRYDLALINYNEALKVFRELGYKKGASICLNNIGIIYKSTGKYDQALNYCNESIELAKDINSVEELMNGYKTISDIYVKMKDFPNAYKFHVQYKQFNDTLLQNESSRNLTELEVEYETEKKELEIKNLNIDNELKTVAIQKKVAESKKQRIIIFSVIGFLLLSITSAFLIYNRLKVIRNQRNIISEQKLTVDEKNKNITDSINYARRIQNAILIPKDRIYESLKDCFILYKPRDIVSGDFYWFADIGHESILAIVDCTGHGVPGAFMSMIGNDLLNQIVHEKKIYQPAEILNELHKGVRTVLRQHEEDSETKDGMDISISKVNLQLNEVEYSGAHNPMFIFRNNGNATNGTPIYPDIPNLEVVKANKISIGGMVLDEERKFSNHKVILNAGDTIYFFTDGYIDQFGGDKNKRFKSKRFRNLLAEIQNNSMAEQETILSTTIEDWKGNFEQTDDITVTGIRILNS